jgi:hypothetical protein
LASTISPTITMTAATARATSSPGTLEASRAPDTLPAIPPAMSGTVIERRT